MKEKLISVIIPVYKAEKYLDQCVESVVNQTYENLEIILVDDGSPDCCPQMCDDWMQRDDRIRVVHKKNGGASSARNTGLDIATGDYIGFVDSDDYIANNMFEILQDTLSESEYKVSCCYTSRVTKDGTIRNSFSANPRQYGLSQALDVFFCGKEITSSFCDKLFDRQIFEDLRFPVGETNEEYTMFIPFMVKSGGIAHTGKQLYYYRETEGSITSSTWKTDAYIVLKHLRKMKDQIVQYELTDNMRAFHTFCAKSAYSIALHLDKNYHRINEKAKQNHKKYIRMMRRYCMEMMFSKYMPTKDKILYMMIVTRTLRWIYKMLGKV